MEREGQNLETVFGCDGNLVEYLKSLFLEKFAF